MYLFHDIVIDNLCHMEIKGLQNRIKNKTSKEKGDSKNKTYAQFRVTDGTSSIHSSTNTHGIRKHLLRSGSYAAVFTMNKMIPVLIEDSVRRAKN